MTHISAQSASGPARPQGDSRPDIDAGHCWTTDPANVCRLLDSTPQGLSEAEARRRLRLHGPNELMAQQSRSALRILRAQIENPLLLILLFAAVVSALSGEWRDAIVVGVIVLVTVVIGYRREYSAETAVAALRARLRTQASVLRDGVVVSVPVTEVVVGDVLLLSAGTLVAADAIILDATDCHVSESVLTGESFPVEKKPGALPRDTPLARRVNSVFLGTNVRSGIARAVVVQTGARTEFGAIAHRLTLRPPETEFERGTRRFGYLLTSAMLLMVLVVFAAHVIRGRPPLETLLFAIALAVGLSPELLPAILGVNLSRGAQSMAARGVLVRRLNAIENLGSMDVLCTDKTGTLTQGVIQLEGAYDARGRASPEVLELAALNAALETGLPSPLDDAILAGHRPEPNTPRKLGEIPFDFVRKRVSVIVERPGGALLVSKGAFRQIAAACERLDDGRPIDDVVLRELDECFERWSSQGIRVLGLATRELPIADGYSRNDEQGLTFRGFLTFLDRPKDGAAQAIADLARLGVTIKLITGDSKLVAMHLAGLVGLSRERILTGAELDALHDEALWHAAERTDLFVEVDPNQKERIILSLKKMGHVVGFLGDGVNDAPAMHAADTSLSVQTAVDVAREAADFVLLEQDLQVIRHGVEQGRRTFANTLKYVLTTTSANLGNMVSMAAASLFLPFLPLLAGQILLNNFISDVPAIGLAQDSVDPELVDRPRRWDIAFIGRFMTSFGLLSSIFDLLTFGLLLGIFHAGEALFQTAWFVESLLTELVIALVVRTRRPVTRSRPGSFLLLSTLALLPLTLAIPYLPGSTALGFVPLPLEIVAALVLITVVYLAAAEVLKKRFYRNLR